MTTELNYLLGVRSIEDAARAIDELSFMEVLDIPTAQIKITNIDRINVRIAPVSDDSGLSKGFMVWIGGSFTSSEMDEIERLSRLADKSVTPMVQAFMVSQMIAARRQGMSMTCFVLGDTPTDSLA